MIHFRRETCTFAVLLGSIFCQGVPAIGQPAAAPQTAPAADEEAARQAFFQSDPWRQTQRTLNEWLSVQQIYTPDEIETLREGFRAQVAEMSPAELEGFTKDLSERLAVLLSPEATDARQWLSRFLSVTRDPEARLGRPLPDVANMTASQIRQELLWLQQHRESRERAQAAFEQTRDMQVQMAQDVQASRQQARQPVQNRASWPANNPAFRSPYAPQRDLRRPLPMSRPVYSVSPWGTPILWHPMSGQW